MHTPPLGGAPWSGGRRAGLRTSGVPLWGARKAGSGAGGAGARRGIRLVGLRLRLAQGAEEERSSGEWREEPREAGLAW